MQARPHRGVPPAEQHAPWSRTSPPGWENVQAFLEVVQRGSFRSAAQHLGQSINLLRRRVAELEQQLGMTLLTRHIDGVRATAEGDRCSPRRATWRRRSSA